MNARKTMKQFYTETEVAHALCISLEALHELLDKHVFDLDNPRPDVLEFTHAELLLLSVWAEPERACNVITMPGKDQIFI
ncbi:MAG: hypothetical protein CXZ00_07275 [Acidobacteria bacterium]|nr:MAG: hypothetical protein CXZ00_07275 [Acidobacteriota bacterium]